MKRVRRAKADLRVERVLVVAAALLANAAAGAGVLAAVVAAAEMAGAAAMAGVQVKAAGAGGIAFPMKIIANPRGSHGNRAGSFCLQSLQFFLSVF
jgi:hypothetical protein